MHRLHEAGSGFISQVNSQQFLTFSRSSPADLPSLSCTIPSCLFMFDVQIPILQNAALIPKQISMIYSTVHPVAGACTYMPDSGVINGSCMHGWPQWKDITIEMLRLYHWQFSVWILGLSWAFSVSVHCSGACLYWINVVLQ